MPSPRSLVWVTDGHVATYNVSSFKFTGKGTSLLSYVDTDAWSDVLKVSDNLLPTICQRVVHRHRLTID